MNEGIRYALLACARRCATALTAVALVTSVAAAHDFWIIPDVFDFGANATVHFSGRQGGTKFPDGSVVQPDRVTDARIIGASSTMRITDMTVEGTSLKLHQKPAAAGQYLVVVALTPRVFRETPAGTVRFLKLEGGAAESARLERENTFAGLDSVIFTAASYAETIAQVGNNGPRAFAKSAGIRLEFVPLNDPGHVRAGDTLHVKILGNGKPVAGIGVESGNAVDSTVASAAIARTSLSADANGVVHVPLTNAGPVMLRAAYASHKAGGVANEWDVSRTTYVFNVRARH